MNRFYHLIVYTKIRRLNQGVYLLYLLSRGKPEPVTSLLEYFSETGKLEAYNFQKETCKALGYYIDFLAAAELSGSPMSLSIFATRLYNGTISEGRDPLGLYWIGTSAASARKYLDYVTRFSDWCVNKYGAPSINPSRAPSFLERVRILRQQEIRQPKALLSHLSKPSAPFTVRSVSGPKLQSFTLQTPKIFPEDRFLDLLFTGFRRRGSREDDPLHKKYHLKDILITLLLHGGGLRVSEPFHLFVCDVLPHPEDPETALVKLYHPCDGAAPSDYTDASGKKLHGRRIQYLQQKWNLIPRNQRVDRFGAGWKDLILENPRQKYCTAHWFPSHWGKLFLTLYKEYILHCRSRHSNHPYLFTSDTKLYRGQMYTLEAYHRAHQRAINKIGLNVNKEEGTTPHGHRHCYGQMLTLAKVEPLIIQYALHHKSSSSQGVYTVPQAGFISATLSKAEETLKDHGINTLPLNKY